MGKEAEPIFKAFTFPEGDEKKYGKIIEKFDEHFAPKRNTNHERACFHRCSEKEGETVKAFIRNVLIWQSTANLEHTERSKSETELLLAFWTNHSHKTSDEIRSNS